MSGGPGEISCSKPKAAELSVEVSGSSLTAGRDLIVAARAERSLVCWFRRFGYRRSLGASALVAFLVFLLASYWPARSTLPIDLDLETSYLRFRLAEDQPVLGPMSVKSLSILDLEEVELQGERVSREPGIRRLGLRFESLESADRRGTLTLQQGYLPAGAVVELKVGKEDRLTVSIDSFEGPLTLSAFGDYRVRFFRSGRRASPWSAMSAATPQVVALKPRGTSLNLVLNVERRAGEELASSIRVNRLWLYELDRTTDGDQSRLEETYHIRSGTLRIDNAEKSIEFGHGTELRLDGTTGQIAALRWGEERFQFRFQGQATSLSRGPREEAVELLSHRSLARSLTADAAAGFTLINGILSLVLSIPAVLRLFRASLRTR